MFNSTNDNPELFAERYSKFSVRDFKNNTRLNINNNEYQAQWPKRDRAIQYWQDQVVSHHLPSIDNRKAAEMAALKNQIHKSSKRGGNKPEFQVSMSLSRNLHHSPDGSRSKKSSVKRRHKSQRRTQRSDLDMNSPLRTKVTD